MKRRYIEREEYIKRKELVPDGTPLGVLNASIPIEIKNWINNEAYRRDNLPISWMVTEVLKLGIDAYELMSDETHDTSNNKPEMLGG